MKNILISILISVTTAFSLDAQSGRKIESQINEYMAAVKAKTTKPELNELLSNDKSHTSILEALAGYYTDTLYDVKLEAYKLTYTIGLKSSVIIVRQNVVEIISRGITSNAGSMANWCARHLSVFNRDDFNIQSRKNIEIALGSQISRMEELLKVAGYLNISEARSSILSMAQYSTKTGVKWCAYLALARMGDAEYTNKVVGALRKQGLNDNVVYELVPDLIYTRQKACIDLAIEFLFEDKKLCSSSNPDNPQKMECGYRIMEYLAPVIKDFPFAVKTSGDIETNDYPAALKTVREWFLLKGSSYEIIDVSF